MDSKAHADPVRSQRVIEQQPWGSLGCVEDIAKAVVFLSSENAGWVTGVNLPVDGGYMAQ